MPTYVEKLNLGMRASPIELSGVDGKKYSLKPDQMNSPFLVMFICNHCPYVKAIEDRLITLGKDLQARQIPVFAISSNDPKDYPEDSFENMKLRSNQKHYSFPYLHDPTQEVAKQYGAVCTPDFFLFNKNAELSYRGRLDDSWKDPLQVNKRELFEAALELLQKEHVTAVQTPAMGCSIKWIKN
jgi:thiol-disulfide isomerase/thioredoxin